MRSALDSMDSGLEASVDLAIQHIQRCILAGRKVMIFGNGGSAADAQHFAAELVSSLHGAPLPTPLRALALTTDTSTITAISNDYDFSQIFARQVRAHCDAGDAVIGLSTSGKSVNVLEGLRVAQKLQASTIAITGMSGLSDPVADLEVRLPSKETQVVQAMTLLTLHAICEDLEPLRSSDFSS